MLRFQELHDLEAAYQAKRQAMIDKALNKVHDDYEKKQELLLRKHQEDLKALTVSSALASSQSCACFPERIILIKLV